MFNDEVERSHLSHIRHFALSIHLITFYRMITSRQGFSRCGIIEDFAPNFKESFV